MLHDYHLYARAEVSSAGERPDLFLHHFVHIPWTQPDAWRVLPSDIREDIYEGILVERHHRLPHALLPAQLPALLPRAVRPRGRRGGRASCASTGREVWVRSYPLPISAESFERTAQRPGRARVRARDPAPPARAPDPARRPRRPVEERAARLHRLRPLPRPAPRVPRAASTFIAHLIPSRQDVPEYAEYLERIEALVAVVNHRHGTTGLDADRAAAAREPRGGDRRLQALRPADGQRDVRRHEPDRQGGAARERAQRRVAPEREHGRARGAGRLRAVGEPVRRAGAGRRDPPRADDVRPRSARGARRG